MTEPAEGGRRSFMGVTESAEGGLGGLKCQGCDRNCRRRRRRFKVSGM